MDIKFIAKTLIASLFVVLSLKSIFFGFGDFRNAVISKGIPMALIVSILVLTIKLGAGLTIMFSDNKKYIKWSAIGLIVFTILATIIYHNPVEDPDQFNNMMKNIAIVGGLLLIVADN